MKQINGQEFWTRYDIAKQYHIVSEAFGGMLLVSAKDDENALKSFIPVLLEGEVYYFRSV